MLSRFFMSPFSYGSAWGALHKEYSNGGPPRRRIMAEMASWQLDAATAERLHRAARAERWGVTREMFARTIERGVRHVFAETPPEASQLERHLSALRLEDF